jgi:soluble lytic murein transglycosylase-like protein
MRYSIKYNLNPKVVASIIYIESTNRPDATSSKNARGLMQITSIAARQVGKQISMLYVPHYNVDTGCAYLRYLLDQKRGNYQQAIRSYYQGPDLRRDRGGHSYYNKFKRAYDRMNLQSLREIRFKIPLRHINTLDQYLFKHEYVFNLMIWFNIPSSRYVRPYDKTNI